MNFKWLARFTITILNTNPEKRCWHLITKQFSNCTAKTTCRLRIFARHYPTSFFHRIDNRFDVKWLHGWHVNYLCVYSLTSE